MISQKTRIPKEVISEIMKQKKSTNHDFFLLKYKKNNLDYSRYCFVVSKKTFKTAVKRNKIKRVFKEKIKNKEIDLPKGFDYVLIVKKETENEL